MDVFKYSLKIMFINTIWHKLIAYTGFITANELSLKNTESCESKRM